ncbi:histidine kinase [Lachnospiraceae bacterium ZAX-1]
MARVAIAFMLLLFICISFFFYRRFLELENRDAIHELEYISRQLAYYMLSMDNYSRTILVNPSVQSLTDQFNQEKDSFSAIKQMEIKSQINRAVQSVPFIHSVSIYAKNGTRIASTEIYPYEYDLLIERRIETPHWYYLNKHPQNTSRTTIEALSLIRPFYRVTSGALLGYIEIVMPERVIADIYRHNSIDGEHVFIVDGAGIVCSCADSLPLGEPYDGFDFLKAHNVGEQFHEYNSFLFLNSHIIFQQYFEELDWYLVSETSLMNFGRPFLSVLLVTVLVTIICILICIFVSHRVSQSITSPINHLIRHTQKIRDGQWTTIKSIDNSHDGTEIAMLFEAFNTMINAQEDLKNDLVESEKMKMKISLELLQQQVNPHFLYNTLDNIFSLAELDEKKVLLNTVMNLSTFYRMGLSSGKTFIAAGEELAITTAYLNIMQVRHFKRFDFSIQCPENLYEYGCLKLLLQPIVENSVYHGLKDLSYPGHLKITVSETKDSICFHIADNGTGISDEKLKRLQSALQGKGDGDGHFGLLNVHKRIQLYYGTPNEATIENRVEDGEQRNSMKKNAVYGATIENRVEDGEQRNSMKRNVAYGATVENRVEDDEQQNSMKKNVAYGVTIENRAEGGCMVTVMIGKIGMDKG